MQLLEHPHRCAVDGVVAPPGDMSYLKDPRNGRTRRVRRKGVLYRPEKLRGRICYQDGLSMNLYSRLLSDNVIGGDTYSGVEYADVSIFVASDD